MSVFDNPAYFNPQYSGPGVQQSPLGGPPSWLAPAQFRPPPAASFPNPAAPAPLAIPPALPPIFSPPAPAAAAPAQPASPWDGIANGINNHALTLMALGAGIAQGGAGKGLADAAAALQAERNQQAQHVNLLQTYKALTDGGVPPQEAQAAIGNPALMRALVTKYLGPRSSGGAASAPVAPASAPAVPQNVPGGSAYKASPPPASAAISPRPNFQGIATNMMPASASAPTLPPNVAAGAAYSLSRNMWRDHAGNRFDPQGKAVA
jgi:hypothetical protein